MVLVYFPRVKRAVAMCVVKVVFAIAKTTCRFCRLFDHGFETDLPRTDRRAARSEEEGQHAIYLALIAVHACSVDPRTSDRRVQFCPIIHHVPSE